MPTSIAYQLATNQDARHATILSAGSDIGPADDRVSGTSLVRFSQTRASLGAVAPDTQAVHVRPVKEQAPIATVRDHVVNLAVCGRQRTRA